MSLPRKRAGRPGGRSFLLYLLLALLGACSSNPPAPVIERSTSPPRAEVPVDGLYRVHRGDTLFGIAFKYGLDHRDLAAWNRISSPYTIYPDQVLRLEAPAPSSRVATAGVRRPEASTSPGKVVEENDAPKPRPVPPAPAPSVAEAQPATAGAKPKPAAPASPPRTGSDGWIWPVEGQVLRSFRAGDPSRNGLDITGSAGQRVVAAGNGEVVYSGNGLIGYGELVIVKHDERMLSAYAHNRRRLVAEGERVRQGQAIAELGRNDRNESVLHFEIRRDGKPVDPLDYLPPK